jgi:hypothetical protein
MCCSVWTYYSLHPGLAWVLLKKGDVVLGVADLGLAVMQAARGAQDFLRTAGRRARSFSDSHSFLKWRPEHFLVSVSAPALIIALAGLIYVSLTYSSVFSMAENPKQIQALYAANQTGWVWNPSVHDYGLRWLHTLLGAVMVGGFIVGMIGRDRVEVFAFGKTFFLWGMVLASLAGVAYLLSLLPILKAFMQSPAIWALTVGVVLALGSLHFFFKKKFFASGTMLFVSVLTMVYARHTVRLLKLAGQFDPAAWKIVPQWSVFALFLVCFVAILAVVGYMIRLVVRAKPNAVPSR